MKLDYDNMGPNERRFMGGKCLVNGREIKKVFFADDVAGVVHSYDVLHDDRVHSWEEVKEKLHPVEFRKRHIVVPSNQRYPVHEILIGQVKLIAPDGRPLVEHAIDEMKETR